MNVKTLDGATLVLHNICHIWWEYDGWRIEVYNKGEPQTISDLPISNDSGLTNNELIVLAVNRMTEEGLSADAFKIIGRTS